MSEEDFEQVLTRVPEENRSSDFWKSEIFFERVRNWGRKRGHSEDLSRTFEDSPLAAVSVILRPAADDTPEILLLKRQTVENDPWSGHISLPGGRARLGETPLQTAIRETTEEAGFDMTNWEIVGSLESVYPGNRSIKVKPFVVIAPGNVSVRVDQREIVDYFWPHLSYFSKSSNETPYIVSREGASFQTPSFVVMGNVVWGMTLRIILNLISELKHS